MTARTDTVVVGAGQAGLSLSRYLTWRRHPHVVLERGRIGERWRSERWDSLRLLTPNWLNRLDGGPAHADADGFLDRAGFVDYLQGYARDSAAPVREHVEVLSVEHGRRGFRVRTDAGDWTAHNVVVATGDCGLPSRPRVSADVPTDVVQLHSSRYRNPAQLAPGGVLVVGAGPSGLQIAAELRRSGREVVLAVGRHARALRRYRGRDVWHWLERLGDLDQSVDEARAEALSRTTPSLGLSGNDDGEQLDLAVLARLGVTLAGRLEGFDGARATFGGGLADEVQDADRRLRVLLERIDEHVGSAPDAPDAEAVAPVPVEGAPESLDLHAVGISTVVWATGYRRAYPWLHVPVLDDRGEIAHRHGATAVPGLSVLGLRFQSRRSSHFIGGVGRDAATLAERLVARDLAGQPRRLGLTVTLARRGALAGGLAG